MAQSKEEIGLKDAAGAEAEATEAENEEVTSGEENTNTIEGLVKMTDQELMDVLGMSRRLAQVREDLVEMSKLSGKARELVEEKVERLLTPDVSEGSFRWALEDAKREAKPKSGGEAYANDSPTSVL